MKFCFTVDSETSMEFHPEEGDESEIALRTKEGLLVEMFGTKEELKRFAEELYNMTRKK